MRGECCMLLGLLLGSLPAHAQTGGTGDFVADIRNGCKVWDPHPQPARA